MKKRWGFFVVVIFFVFAGCGGGGGGGDGGAPEAQSNAPPVSVPIIKSRGFAPIPESEFAERIVVAANEDFAAVYPGWEEKAQKIIDFINGIFARTTRKQYVVDHFATYKLEESSSIASRTDLFVSNNWTNARNIQGRTILFAVHSGLSTIPVVYWTVFGTVQNASGNFELLKWSPNKTATSLAENSEYFYSDVSAVLLQLGRNLGLEDWWRYEFSDLSGALPDLGSYKLREEFPDDPMILPLSGYSDPGQPPYDWSMMQFSDFNAFLINKNANYQYSKEELREGIPSEVKVKVFDNGFPVIGAKVTVYGALSRALNFFEAQINMGQTLEALTTNANGEAIITSADFLTVWRAKGIKAEFNGKYSGAVLTLIDLQSAFLMEEKDDYLLTLTLLSPQP